MIKGVTHAHLKQFGIIQNIQTFLIPQINSLVGTLFTVSYSKAALVKIHEITQNLSEFYNLPRQIYYCSNRNYGIVLPFGYSEFGMTIIWNNMIH